MLTAYFDDSGTHPDSDVVLWYGLLGIISSGHISINCGPLSCAGRFHAPPSRFVPGRRLFKDGTSHPDRRGNGLRIVPHSRQLQRAPGAAEGSGSHATEGLRSATAWTSGYDTKNKIMYYHTQHNRRVRKIDVKKIHFDAITALLHMPMDNVKTQDIEDRTP